MISVKLCALILGHATMRSLGLDAWILVSATCFCEGTSLLLRLIAAGKPSKNTLFALIIEVTIKMNHKKQQNDGGQSVSSQLATPFQMHDVPVHRCLERRTQPRHPTQNTYKTWKLDNIFFPVSFSKKPLSWTTFIVGVVELRLEKNLRPNSKAVVSTVKAKPPTPL